VESGVSVAIAATKFVVVVLAKCHNKCSRVLFVIPRILKTETRYRQRREPRYPAKRSRPLLVFGLPNS